MRPGARRRGFTLMELMIVVTIIGILGGMARMAFARISLRARGAAYVNDCRVFTEAFQRYAIEKGAYPSDQTQRRTVPPNMAPYLRTTSWLRVTPLGGDYEWDNISARTSLPRRVNAAVRVNGCTLRMSDLQQIDRWFDDGNTNTGNIRVTDAGARVFYIIES